jgi:hypothetical protein
MREIQNSAWRCNDERFLCVETTIGPRHSAAILWRRWYLAKLAFKELVQPVQAFQNSNITGLMSPPIVPSPPAISIPVQLSHVLPNFSPLPPDSRLIARELFSACAVAPIAAKFSLMIAKLAPVVIQLTPILANLRASPVAPVCRGGRGCHGK